MKCIKCEKELQPYQYDKKTFICKKCQHLRPCAICNKMVSPYGLKELSNNKEICRRGICRRIYDNSRTLEEAISMFKWAKEEES